MRARVHRWLQRLMAPTTPACSCGFPSPAERMRRWSDQPAAHARDQRIARRLADFVG